jgi:squalene synthase HpnC
MPQNTTIRQAFRYCRDVVRHHYENFPVGSYAAPGRLRPYIHSIYAFARHADDVADEGTASEQDRLAALDEWGRQLDDCFSGTASHPVFIALAESIARFHLPRQPFDDLLTAFRQDAGNPTYDTYDDLLAYCRHSANPIGRLVLAIFGCSTEGTVYYSDLLCTALQLTNFWQDTRQDISRGRVYIPLEDFGRFGYTADELRSGVNDERLHRLVAFQVERTKALLISSRQILPEVPWRLRLELALTWHGGMLILDRIMRNNCDVLAHRPRISKADAPGLLLASLRTTL